MKDGHVHDLVVSFIWQEEGSEKPKISFLDGLAYVAKILLSLRIVSQNQKKDRVKQNYQFVMVVMEHLRAEGRFERFNEVAIWSDGGPSHYKVYNTQYLMSKFQKTLATKLTWNFFWAHRGHNTCDGHAGVLKRAVREEELNYNLVSIKELVGGLNKL